MATIPASGSTDLLAPPRFFAAIVDGRHPECREFGRAMQGRGSRIVELRSGDITDFWYQEMDAEWRAHPNSWLAGMTEYPALFLLERFAWDHGLRVAFRAEHQFLTAQSVAHEVMGHEEAVRALSGKLEQTPWPEALADALSLCGAARGPRSTIRGTGPCRDAIIEQREPLYTWIIAPAM